MCCIFLIFAFLGPRVGSLIWWLAEPGRWDEAFDTLILPIVGIVFLPWTTIMYVVVQPGGVEGVDWLWLGLSVLADLAMYSGGVYKRDQVPGYLGYLGRESP